MKKIKFVLFLFLITLFSCSEDIYDYYEKCSESDFEQNCWLPKFLKNIDCKNITIYHNLDTNEIWGKFYIYGDSFFIQKESDFIMNEKQEKRLKKIGLEENYLILRNNTDDSDFNIRLFIPESETDLLFFMEHINRFILSASQAC